MAQAKFALAWCELHVVVCCVVSWAAGALLQPLRGRKAHAAAAHRLSECLTTQWEVCGKAAQVLACQYGAIHITSCAGSLQNQQHLGGLSVHYLLYSHTI
jgi:hypothetical protein